MRAYFRSLPQSKRAMLGFAATVSLATACSYPLWRQTVHGTSQDDWVSVKKKTPLYKTSWATRGEKYNFVQMSHSKESIDQVVRWGYQEAKWWTEFSKCLREESKIFLTDEFEGRMKLSCQRSDLSPETWSIWMRKS